MKSVLVTGSSRGIGRAIAVALSRDGFELVLHCHSNRKLAENLAAEIVSDGGEQPRILQFDIGDREAALAAIAGDIESHGAYWGVVCNAGIAQDAAFPSISGEAWDKVINTNLNGFYNVVQPLVMPMVRKREGGRIITLSSVSGIIGNRGQTNYSAAKAGIIGATKSLAIELAKRKITVNCVAPGLIDTEMLDQIHLNEALKMVPLRRLGKPEEVAGLVAYLFSESAAYITRQVFSVNGGMI